MYNYVLWNCKLGNFYFAPNKDNYNYRNNTLSRIARCELHRYKKVRERRRKGAINISRSYFLPLTARQEHVSKKSFSLTEDTFQKVQRISTQRLPFCARTVREINCRRANRILFRAGKHGEVSLRLTEQTAACNDINPNERLLVSIFLSPTRATTGLFLKRALRAELKTSGALTFAESTRIDPSLG